MSLRLTWSVPVEVIVDLPDDTDEEHDIAWDRVRTALEQVEGFTNSYDFGGVRFALSTYDLPDPTETTDGDAS
jgi:hypothetical protein